jgi:hypothetical protein
LRAESTVNPQTDFGFETMAPYVHGLERLLEIVKDHVHAEHEAWVERESVEQVFLLTGGELDDKPWEPWEPCALSDRDADHVLAGHDTWSHHASERLSFRYSYDGVPEWAEEDFPDLYDNGVSYRTVVLDCLFGFPPEVLHDRGETWTRVREYGPGGERECSMRDGDGGETIVGSENWRDDIIVHGGKEPFDRESRCPLCEADSGEPHGARAGTKSSTGCRFSTARTAATRSSTTTTTRATPRTKSVTHAVMRGARRTLTTTTTTSDLT